MTNTVCDRCGAETVDKTGWIKLTAPLKEWDLCGRCYTDFTAWLGVSPAVSLVTDSDGTVHRERTLDAKSGAVVVGPS